MDLVSSVMNNPIKWSSPTALFALVCKCVLVHPRTQLAATQRLLAAGSRCPTSRVGPCELLSVRSQAATCHELWETEVRHGPEEDCVCGRGQKVGWTLAMVLL